MCFCTEQLWDQEGQELLSAVLPAICSPEDWGRVPSCFLWVLSRPGVLDLWKHHFSFCLCYHVFLPSDKFLYIYTCVCMHAHKHVRFLYLLIPGNQTLGLAYAVQVLKPELHPRSFSGLPKFSYEFIFIHWLLLWLFPNGPSSSVLGAVTWDITFWRWRITHVTFAKSSWWLFSLTASSFCVFLVEEPFPVTQSQALWCFLVNNRNTLLAHI